MALTHTPRLVAALILSVLTLAGCGGSTDATPPTASPVSQPPVTTPASEPPPATTTPPATATPPTTPSTATPRPVLTPEGVTLVKTGGIAGITETIVVKSDGTWSRKADRGGPATTGKLTAAQMAALQRLVADPRLEAEASPTTTGPGRCSDAFVYVLTAGSRRIHYTACGQGARPEVTMAIVALLQSTTNR